MRCVAKRILTIMAAVALVPALGACPSDDDTGDDGMAGSTGAEATDTDEPTEGGDETATGEESGSDETGEDLGPWNSLDERPCPDDSFLTYESFGGPHMLTFCTGCHHSRLPADMRQGAPIAMNFDDIEDIRAHADRIWARAGDHNDTMPPVGPATADERTMLGEWLACGAPTDADLGM